MRIQLHCALWISVLALGMMNELQAFEAPQLSPQEKAEQERYFETKVRPILAGKCFQCHGPKKQQAGVRLDSRNALVNDGAIGPIVTPGKPDESRLIEVIQYSDYDIQMPPEEKLPQESIAALTEWIRMGAPWPKAMEPSTPKQDTDDGYDFAAARKSHWAFQPVADPEPPSVENESAIRSTIDRFVVARLEKAGRQLSRPADRRTLIRRATFDLNGIPPTAEQIDDFINDTAPGAFARVVDRLLSSPLYGQRWGRYWLDIARYADTKGYVFTAEIRYPYAYVYRDYVIRSFNEDLPYNRFLMEQIAADQLDLNGDARALAALGFLTVGRRFRNNQQDIIDDRIDVVTRGLMGLTVSCARCHDHKYDPIPTADYYSLYGVFANSREPDDLPLAGVPEKTDAYREYLAELKKREAAVEDHIQKNYRELLSEARARVADYLQLAVKNSAESNEGFGLSFSEGEPRPQIVARWVDYLKRTAKQHHAVFAPWHELAELPMEQFAEQAGEVINRYQQALADSGESPRVNPLIIKALAEKPPESMFDVAKVYGELLTDIEKQWQALQKEAENSTDQATNSPQALPDPHAEELRQVLYGEGTPTALTVDRARRLFDRVASNKLRELQKNVERWHLESPGSPPRAMVLQDVEHPTEQVVFLRGSAQRRGDKVPRRFPQILSDEDSGLFTHGSGRLELARAIADADNPLTARVLVNRVWMHHFGDGLVRTPSDFGTRSDPPTHPELLDYLTSRFIEDGWSIKKLHRRIMLSAVYQQSSESNPEAARQDPENRLIWRMPRRRLDFEAMRDSMLAVSGQLDPANGGLAVDLMKQPFSKRRTVYGFVNRNNLPSLYRTFDYANPDSSTGKRPITTVPQQALFAMNSRFVIEQARHLAAYADAADESDAAAGIHALYRRVYGRAPVSEELELGLQFIASQSQSAEAEAAQSDMNAWEKYAQVLLLSNEFLFVD